MIDFFKVEIDLPELLVILGCLRISVCLFNSYFLWLWTRVVVPIILTFGSNNGFDLMLTITDF